MKARTGPRPLHPLRPLVTVVLVAVALLVTPPAADACTCATPPPLPEQVGAADLAVVGTVVDVRERARGAGEPGPMASIEMVVEVESVIAGDADTPADGSVDRLSVHTDRSSCGAIVQPGGRVGFVAHRDGDGLLRVSTCSGPVDPAALLDVDVDLPEPAARGPATIVTLHQVGPSRAQLRDPTGGVVAWGTLPGDLVSASICPGATTVLGERWEPGRDGSRTLAAVDVRTAAVTSLARLDERDRAVLWCASATGDLAVLATDASPTSDSELVVLRTDSGAELRRIPIGGPMELTVLPDGTVVVASAAGIEVVDLDTGERTLVAAVAPGRRVRALVAHRDGGLSALVGGDTELSPIDELLTVGASLDGADAWAIEPSGEVRGFATAPDGSRILEMREGTLRVHDADGRHVDTVAEEPPRDRPWTGEVWLGLTEDGSPTYAVDRADVVARVLLQPPSSPPRTAVLTEPFTPTDERRAVHTRTALQALAAGDLDVAEPQDAPADDPSVDDGAAEDEISTGPTGADDDTGGPIDVAPGWIAVLLAVVVLVGLGLRRSRR